MLNDMCACMLYLIDNMLVLSIPLIQYRYIFSAYICILYATHVCRIIEKGKKNLTLFLLQTTGLCLHSLQHKSNLSGVNSDLRQSYNDNII